MGKTCSLSVTGFWIVKGVAYLMKLKEYKHIHTCKIIEWGCCLFNIFLNKKISLNKIVPLNIS